MNSSLIQIFQQFIRFLNRLKVKYALVGGIAVGYWAEERATKDIDFTISLDNRGWEKLHSEIKKKSNWTIHTLARDSNESIPYLVRINIKNILVDLIISLTDFQESLLERVIPVSINKTSVNIATAEDIIISKLIANRTQDKADIEKIFDMVSDLDKKYLIKWAKLWQVESSLSYYLKNL